MAVMTPRKHPMLSGIHRALGWVTFVEKAIAVVLLLVILGFTFAQVTARFLFEAPFTWTDELARFSYVWLTFLAAAAVMSDRSHVTVEVGDRWIRRRARLFLNAIGMAAVVLACVMLTTGSFEFLEHRAAGSSTALGIPMAIFYGVVAAGIVLIGLHALANIFLIAGDWLLDDDEYAALEAKITTRPEEGI